MLKIDHHLHTTRYSPDSIIEPRQLIERAHELGLDGVVITEHDVQWPEEELAELAEVGRKQNVLVLSGAEISAQEGHFLVYGLPDLKETPVGITLHELLPVVKRHGAAIIAAHPFRWDQDFEAILAEHGPVFDALELVSNNVTTENRTKVERVLQSHTMGATGSSDAHQASVIGCYFTEFPGPIATRSDFVAAIRGQKGRPRHREGAWLACGPVE